MNMNRNERTGILRGIQLIIETESMPVLLKKQCILDVMDSSAVARREDVQDDGDTVAENAVPLRVDDVELSMDWVESVFALSEIG